MQINNIQDLIDKIKELNPDTYFSIGKKGNSEVILANCDTRKIKLPEGFKFNSSQEITNDQGLSVRAYDNRLNNSIMAKYSREMEILGSVIAANNVLLEDPSLSNNAEIRKKIQYKIDKAAKLLDMYERKQMQTFGNPDAYILFGKQKALEKRNEKIVKKTNEIRNLEGEKQILKAQMSETLYSKIIFKNRKKRIETKIKSLEKKQGKLFAKQRAVVIVNLIKEIKKYQRQRYRLDKQQTKLSKIADKKEIVQVESKSVEDQLSEIQKEITAATTIGDNITLQRLDESKTDLEQRLKKLKNKTGKLNGKMHRKLIFQNLPGKVTESIKARYNKIRQRRNRYKVNFESAFNFEAHNTRNNEASPEGPSPEGPIPEGPSPEGPIPEGPIPEGPIPMGPIPEGPSPEGPIPEGPIPEGPNPEGPNPEGPIPEGPIPEGPNPEGPIPEGPNPEGPNPEGPNPEGPIPEGPNPEGPIPMGPIPEGPIPEGPNPEDPEQMEADSETKEDNSLNKYTVPELVVMAKAMGLKNYSSSRKAALIEVMKKSDKDIQVVLTGYENFKELVRNATKPMEKGM